MTSRLCQHQRHSTASTATSDVRRWVSCKHRRPGSTCRHCKEHTRIIPNADGQFTPTTPTRRDATQLNSPQLLSWSNWVGVVN